LAEFERHGGAKWQTTNSKEDALRCIERGFSFASSGLVGPRKGTYGSGIEINLALEACRQNIVDGLAFFQKLLVFDQFVDAINKQLNEFSL